ncbi:MAG: putative ATP-dependent endonuclease of the family [Solirubrobacterales bacterium]|jgi:predicted ATP-dependent endonuclease of OLD family|nr:putative ATP-dependent endonuclease of the family [Solirubrobacterales bacterium]
MDRSQGDNAPVKIRSVSIQNFRGIKNCEWKLDRRLACLVGPGDSTKTTILEAIGLTLSRSYRPRFGDADFHRCNTEEPIKIEVAVAELPDALIAEQSLGKDRSGIGPNGSFQHDPQEGTEECLIVRMVVDQTLEPRWTVVRPEEGTDEGKPISAAQRRALGFFRLGEDSDSHLRWGRGSALNEVSEDTDEAGGVVLAAHREARIAAFDAIPSQLQEAAGRVQKASRKLGAGPYRALRPGLDPAGSSGRFPLLLHDEVIPLTSQGLGTRRLTGIAIQEQAVVGGSIIAVDEIEHGLDPHRLCHLLRYLKAATKREDLQVILTTHAPVTIAALEAADICVVRSEAGKTTVAAVPSDLDEVQGAVRHAPSALLGRRVLIGEGATEAGFIRRLCGYGDERRGALDEPTSITAGVEIVNGGGGDQALQRAIVFSKLGYPSAVLVDNDDSEIDARVAEAENAGVVIVRWSSGRAIEDEFAHSLSAAGLREFVALGIGNRGEESIRAQVEAQLGKAPGDLEGVDPFTWTEEGADEEEALRMALAAAAKGTKAKGEGRGEEARREERSAWFKREDHGERLAELWRAHHAEMREESALPEVLEKIKAFVYGG